MDIKFKTENNEVVNINDKEFKYKGVKDTSVNKISISDITSASLVNNVLSIKLDELEHDFIIQKGDNKKIKPFVNMINGVEDLVDPTTQKNKLVMISGILTIAYLIFALFAYSDTGQAPTDEWGQMGYELGRSIGFALIAPHFIMTVIGLILNVISYFINNKWLILATAIVYVVAMLRLYVNAPFLIIQTVLCFVAFARTLKIEQN